MTSWITWQMTMTRMEGSFRLSQKKGREGREGGREGGMEVKGGVREEEGGN